MANDPHKELPSGKAATQAEAWLFDWGLCDSAQIRSLSDLLDRFAAEAVREEREACVKLADEWREHVPKNGLAFTHGWEQSALTIAEEIRARSEEEADDGE